LLSEHLEKLSSAGGIQHGDGRQTNAFLPFQRRTLLASFMPGLIICSQESPVHPSLGESHSWVLWASAQVTPMTEPGSFASPSGPIIGEGPSAEFQCPLPEVQETESHLGSTSL